MPEVTSDDGTTIAFEQRGAGPPLVLVGGAFEQRAMDSETAQLAAAPLLTEHFTVIHYDRRGRGASTDTLPYALEREIEDIDALITAAGGAAFVFGISSGAALAFEAAFALGPRVRKLALYEPPYNDDPTARQAWREYRRQLAAVLAEGRRGAAVALFMELLGVPAEHIDGMRQYPLWPMWEAVAPTLAYDAAALGAEGALPTERAADQAVPTLVMDGAASYPFMHTAATALAAALPHGEHRTLAGQAHEVSAAALAPVLVDFFGSGAPS
jgi:pimeloyl-ACP methyl ester carboxylesterase